MITLAIIGVVAALTIPTVVRNYRKTQAVTKFQKIISTLNQATQLSVIDNGSIFGWDSTKGGEYAYNTYYKKYLKVAKELGSSLYHENYKDLNNLSTTYMYNSSPNYYTIILTDGTMLIFSPYKKREWGFMAVLVDLDGPQKGANKFGVDTFELILDDKTGKFSPPSIGETNSTKYLYCNKKSLSVGGNGRSCGYNIILDGWQIKYDW